MGIGNVSKEENLFQALEDVYAIKKIVTNLNYLGR